jgi:hypothetical protein
MKTLVLSLLMIVTLSTVAYAGLDWEPLGQTDTQDIIYDPESLTQKGHPVASATMNMIMDYNTPVTVKEGTVGSVFVTAQFNCQKALMRVVLAEAYSHGSASGAVMDSNKTPQPWTPLLRTSPAFKVACVSKNIRLAEEFEASEWGAVARATKPSKANKSTASSIAKLKGMILAPQEAMEDAELKRQLHRHSNVLDEYMQERCMAKTGRRC